MEKIIVNNKEELRAAIKAAIAVGGDNADLNHIDVSNITDMSCLFMIYPNFNGDISKWYVSNVVSMDHMFAMSKFDGDISKWDTISLETAVGMFMNSQFNNDSLSRWDTMNLTDATNMF